MPLFKDKSIANLLEAIARRARIARSIGCSTASASGTWRAAARALADAFGSIDAIAEAPVEELAAVDGVGDVIARRRARVLRSPRRPKRAREAAARRRAHEREARSARRAAHGQDVRHHRHARSDLARGGEGAHRGARRQSDQRPLEEDRLPRRRREPGQQARQGDEARRRDAGREGVRRAAGRPLLPCHTIAGRGKIISPSPACERGPG